MSEASHHAMSEMMADRLLAEFPKLKDAFTKAETIRRMATYLEALGGLPEDLALVEWKHPGPPPEPIRLFLLNFPEMIAHYDPRDFLPPMRALLTAALGATNSTGSR